MAAARGSGARASGRAGGSRSASGRSGTAAKAAIPQLGWSEIRPAPVILISGPEDFLADRAFRLLRDQIRREDPGLEVHELDAASSAPGELFTLASPSLFAEARLIRADHVEKCSDDFLSEALSYLEQPAAGAVLVLRHGGGVRGKRLLDSVRAGTGGGIEIICAAITRESDKLDFVQAEFRAAGREISAAAVRALVSAFSDDLAELASACRQLIADTTGEITDAVVDKYYSGRVETTAFAVADAAVAGRHGEALRLLRHALASGADPVPIVAALAMKIRAMAKVSGSRGSSNELAGRLGLAPWQVDRARRDLDGWDDAGLGRAIREAALADARIKGAGRDPIYALEQLVTVLASRGR